MKEALKQSILSTFSVIGAIHLPHTFAIEHILLDEKDAYLGATTRCENRIAHWSHFHMDINVYMYYVPYM